MNVGRIVGIAVVWAVSLVGVGLWAQGSASGPQVTTRTTGGGTFTVTDSQITAESRIVHPGDAVGPVLTGADIGFQPMFSPNTPAGAVAGRWMVRVDGEWRVATGVVQTVPAR